MRTVKQVHEPPNPEAKCICGQDSSADGARYSNICPKHDGRRYDIVEYDEDEDPEASDARLR